MRRVAGQPTSALLATGARVTALASLVASLACVGPKAYVWVDDLPADPPFDSEVYTIAPGDVLSITLWSENRFSGESVVRSDGRVTLPLIGDVVVAGLSPTDATLLIKGRLQTFIDNPKITVSLASSPPPVVAVLGEVNEAGRFEIRAGEGVLDALAHAKGVSGYATDTIYVIRRDPEFVRVRFSYRKLVESNGRGSAFELRDGDVVVVK